MIHKLTVSTAMVFQLVKKLDKPINSWNDRIEMFLHVVRTSCNKLQVQKHCFIWGPPCSSGPWDAKDRTKSLANHPDSIKTCWGFEHMTSHYIIP